MQKKFLFITLLIIIMCFSFTITSFASTDYTNNKTPYTLDINFKTQTHFNLPNFSSVGKFRFNDDDIYFILLKACKKDNSHLIYDLYVSDNPIYISDINGRVITFSSDSSIASIVLENNESYWGNVNWLSNNTFKTSYSSEYSYDILMSSDNISYNGDIICYKYTKSPLTRTVQTIDLRTNGVMKEIIVVLPVVLATIISLIGIRKAYRFIKKKTQNA